MPLISLTAQQWGNLLLTLIWVLAAVFFGRPLINYVLRTFVHRIAGKTSTALDDMLIRAVSPPLHALIMVAAVVLAVNRLDFLPAAWYGTLNDIFFLLYLFIGTVIAWRVINAVFRWYIKEVARETDTKLDEVLAPFLRRVALVVLVAIVLIMLLNRFDIDVSGLVATLGIASLAIALAAQAALADIFSGIIIMIDQPFRIGDRIEIQDLDTWGDVKDIGLRSTQIRTRDNRMVIVPNSVIGKSLIVNHNYPDSQYRIEVHIGIAYGSDLARAREVMSAAVRTVDGVLEDKPVEALFLEFGSYALTFRLRWWIESYVDTRRMFDSVNTAVYGALNQAGIQVPFPQQTVSLHLDSDTAGQLSAMLQEKSDPVP